MIRVWISYSLPSDWNAFHELGHRLLVDSNLGYRNAAFSQSNWARSTANLQDYFAVEYNRRFFKLDTGRDWLFDGSVIFFADFSRMNIATSSSQRTKPVSAETPSRSCLRISPSQS